MLSIRPSQATSPPHTTQFLHVSIHYERQWFGRKTIDSEKYKRERIHKVFRTMGASVRYTIRCEYKIVHPHINQDHHSRGIQLLGAHRGLSSAVGVDCATIGTLPVELPDELGPEISGASATSSSPASGASNPFSSGGSIATILDFRRRFFMSWPKDWIRSRFISI